MSFNPIFLQVTLSQRSITNGQSSKAYSSSTPARQSFSPLVPGDKSSPASSRTRSKMCCSHDAQKFNQNPRCEAKLCKTAPLPNTNFSTAYATVHGAQLEIADFTIPPPTVPSRRIRPGGHIGTGHGSGV